jgi:hypothetical protein
VTNFSSSNKRWYTALYVVTGIFALSALGKHLTDAELGFLGVIVPVFLGVSQWGQVKREAPTPPPVA